MLALARFTLKGPYQAAAVVGLLAMLSVLIPQMELNAVFGVVVASLCMLLSCTLVGLIILTQGSVSGLKVIVVSMLGISLAAWILIEAPELGLWTGLVQWLPIILLTQVLRVSKSLAVTMLLGVLLGAVGIVAQYLIWGTLEAEMISQAVQGMGQVGELEASLVERNIQLARLFVLAIVAMAYLILMLIVLIARWMQSSLAESKGFGDEFRALTLGKPAAVVALSLALLSFAAPQTWLNSLVFLLVIAFMFQGLAVIHCKLVSSPRVRLLLGLFYTLLLVFPQVVALTAITGVIDNWLVFRKKTG